jgi:hypothetical protein
LFNLLKSMCAEIARHQPVPKKAENVCGGVASAPRQAEKAATR